MYKIVGDNAVSDSIVEKLMMLRCHYWIKRPRKGCHTKDIKVVMGSPYVYCVIQELKKKYE